MARGSPITSDPAAAAGRVETFDYVIVGAGTAGSVLARRLAEDEGTTICVLEAGAADRHPYLHLPAGFIKVIFDPRFTWRFVTEPGPYINGRRISLPQGKVVGGSSSVNGMIFSRGLRSDYDAWAAAGNRGWGYLDVLPYFHRVEQRIGEHDPRYRGSRGPIQVTTTDLRHPLCEAFIAGAANAGIPRNSDFNGVEQTGVGYMQRSIHRGWRRSAATTYLVPALRTGRVELRTSATVLRVAHDAGRAIGVSYVPGPAEVPRLVRARREVIVCAGTINTPKVLQLSGIGPASLLQPLGIPVLRDLPVGDNLRDHFSIRVVARVRHAKTINELARGPRLALQAARWAMKRPSVLALSPALVHWFWKSDPALADPDLQGIFTPASYKEGTMGLLDSFPGMSAGVNQHRPESAGHVRIGSRDPHADPFIQPNYLIHPRDRQTLVAGIKLARCLLRTPELSRYYLDEKLPGERAASDDDLLAFARQYGTTSYHVTGTCRMGPAGDRGAVVDDALRVHGIDGLRVVDASVMPNIPSANTYAATLMIAEKAADLVRGRAPLARIAGVV